MSACNFQAPNGRPSLLYAGLEQIIGEKQAITAWYTLRTPKYLSLTGDWTNPSATTSIPQDENGEPTIQAALQVLNLGTLAQVTQQLQFATRWKLKSVTNTLNTYYGTRNLAQKMQEQLQVSGHLYNLINIRYNPITAHIEISPRQIKVSYQSAANQEVYEEVPGAEAIRAQIETARRQALDEASKPLVDMIFIKDSAVLNSRVMQEVQVEDSDEVLTREISVGKWQAQIKKEFEIFKKLVNCI
jgi:hypothetical protein